MDIIKKNKFTILALLTALVVITYFVFGNKSLDGMRQDLKPAETTLSEDTNPDNVGEVIKVCYLKETQSSLGGELVDRQYIEVNYAENAVLTGFMSSIPAEKDSQKGTFVGAQNGEFINVVYSGAGEGMTWEEQIIFVISDTGIIRANYVDQIADENGILMYSDLAALEFDPKNLITPVDCSTVGLKAVGRE